jgi:hypothetical protein
MMDLGKARNLCLGGIGEPMWDLTATTASFWLHWNFWVQFQSLQGNTLPSHPLFRFRENFIVIALLALQCNCLLFILSFSRF